MTRLPRTAAAILSKPIVRQFLSFALVGLLAVATHYSVMVVLIETLHWGTLLSSTTGFFSGGIVSYALNQWLTFEARPSIFIGFAKFAALISIGAVINGLIVAFLAGAGMHYLLAQAIATAVVLFWNFFSARLFVFLPGPADAEGRSS